MFRPDKAAAVSAAVFAGVFWGGIGIFARLLSPEMTVLSMVAYRTLIAAAFFLGIVLISGRIRELSIERKDWVKLLLFGLVFNGLSFYFFTEAVLRTKIGTALAIFYAAPIFVSIVAFFLLKESLNKWRLVAISMALVGTLSLFQPQAGGAFLGNLFSLLAGIFYALYIVYGRVLRKYSTLSRTFWSFFLTGISFLALTGLFGQFPRTLSQNSALLLLLFSATISAAFFLFNYAIKSMSATTTSILLLSEPISATLLAFLLFKESLGYGAFSAYSLIIFAAIVDSLGSSADETNFKSAKRGSLKSPWKSKQKNGLPKRSK